MTEIKVNKNPNIYGYYGISYFNENKKFIHFVMKTYEDCLLYVAEKSNYTAEKTFSGSKYEIWRY